MIDVLLINPRSFYSLPSYLPYGLLYLAAYLRQQGLRVKIYDSNTFDIDWKTYLKRRQPQIVGISILSGPCIIDAVDKAKYIKAKWPQIKLIWGGIHTTIFPQLVLKQPDADYIVVNEGEPAFFQLCQYLLAGKGKLSQIKNVGYRRGRQLVINPIRDFIDLNKLSLPAWDLVPMEKYIHHKFYASRVVTLHTSRGCPWNCTYCYNRLVNFRCWRAMSAQRIFDQIMHLQDRYQVNGFQFYDDEFDVSPKRVKEFCQLVIDRQLDIKWGHYSRTNMADKQQTTNDIKRAFAICHDLGIKTGAMFMIGVSTETAADLTKTVKLINTIKPYQAICTIYRPYPGSALYQHCLDQKLITVPTSLVKQADFFDIGSTDINVSQIPDDKLKHTYQYYWLYNIKRELKFAFGNLKFSLIWSRLKQSLSWKLVRRWLNG